MTVFKQKRIQFFLLIAASYFFYAVSSGWFFLLLVTSTLLDFYCGKYMHTSKNPKRWLILSIVGNVGVLAYFKYTNFLIDNINALSQTIGVESLIPTFAIALPIGISFYTFQSMSYSIDVYRKRLKPIDSLLDFSLFVSFFPQLVAGPIVRAVDFLPQLKKPIRLIPENLKVGISYIGWGLIKKAVFADNIAPFVNTIFADPASYTSIQIIIATFAFAIQIYCDFSGYTDMAIGSARVLGFKFPLNFNKPFFAKNPSDFWRKWHISLSSWVNDYIYTPLFRSLQQLKVIQRFSVKTRFFIAFILAIIIAEFLLGLWHGASWNFVWFGIWHGLIIIIYHSVKKYWNAWYTPIQMLITFYGVLIGFILFRQSDAQLLWITLQKFVFFDFALSGVFEFLFAHQQAMVYILLFTVIHFLSWYKEDTLHWISTLSTWKWYLFVVLVTLVALSFYPSFSTEFIYFQF
ncbi:MAG: alginate O-acetyltransferase complex protein AlgI [Candidatus Woesearchaeota archaeon]|jgi:alginate O-acetyltransferase complex protein AlgI